MNNSDILSIKQRFEIIGNSPKLNNAIRVAIQVSGTDMSVLITGESGSGKESFSKIIHSLSHRKHGQFIAINCGAIPEGTIDSELFGHEKGAFTGAYDSRKGYFEVTNGGTIFLDEIGEMPLGTQARLLRVLENGEFIKVGSSKVQKTDLRVIAASNVDLVKAVENGKFREDLYYRLNTVPINVPPLRERGNDIILLFRKFASDFSEKYHVKPIELTAEAKDILISYHFPGNIRQLKNLAEQISVLAMDRVIDTNQLVEYLPDQHSNLPAIVPKSEKYNSEFSERDILYKVLFDLKSDFNELKSLVLKILKKDDSTELIEKHGNLFSKIPNEGNEDADTEELKPSSPLLLESAKDQNNYSVDIQDITHETEDDESLSIEKKEKELIMKALHRNNRKRKQAAKDLGISERTLYRKIKQYELEEF